MTEKTELDPARRYLVPVARLQLPDEPDLVHLSVYEWLPRWEHWATGLALCGYSAEQGALPEGTAVTCGECEAYRPRYERYLAPGYKPEDDDPKALRARVSAADELLRTTLRVYEAVHSEKAPDHRLGELPDCPVCDHAVAIRKHLDGTKRRAAVRKEQG